LKKLFLIFSLLIFCLTAYGQQKYALVIGNGNYITLSKLRNPVNDAEDMAVALTDLGFNVDKVLNGDLEKIESAVMRLKNRLSTARNSYGFLFFAGHGVQSGGANFLIPVGANIPSENYLRNRAVSVQTVLDELNDAGNELNVVVLDACRDNPFTWGRSANRGLTVIGSQPADSIVVYATSAGSIAQDGVGRNGLFTSHLLNNLRTPGLEVTEIFRRTGQDVSLASDRKQIPAVYVQFFGSAYFDKSASAAPRIEHLPQTLTSLPVASKPLVIKPIAYSFMNFALGLGSYLQGDVISGALVTGGYAAAIGLITWELNLNKGDPLSGVPGNIGVAVGAAAIAFGFVKPLFYNENRRLASVIDNFDIALVSSERNKSAVALRYTYNF
jgi:hypothetical protein